MRRSGSSWQHRSARPGAKPGDVYPRVSRHRRSEPDCGVVRRSGQAGARLGESQRAPQVHRWSPCGSGHLLTAPGSRGLRGPAWKHRARRQRMEDGGRAVCARRSDRRRDSDAGSGRPVGAGGTVRPDRRYRRVSRDVLDNRADMDRHDRDLRGCRRSRRSAVDLHSCHGCARPAADVACCVRCDRREDASAGPLRRPGQDRARRQGGWRAGEALRLRARRRCGARRQCRGRGRGRLLRFVVAEVRFRVGACARGDGHDAGHGGTPLARPQGCSH